MFGNGYSCVQHLLISSAWHRIPFICNLNYCETNAHVGTSCTHKWQVPLFPSNFNFPLIMFTFMVFGCIAGHLRPFPLHFSIFCIPSVSLICSGSPCPSSFLSCCLLSNNLYETLPGSPIECKFVFSNVPSYYTWSGRKFLSLFLCWLLNLFEFCWDLPNHNLNFCSFEFILYIIQCRLNIYYIFWLFGGDVVLLLDFIDNVHIEFFLSVL